MRKGKVEVKSKELEDVRANVGVEEGRGFGENYER